MKKIKCFFTLFLSMAFFAAPVFAEQDIDGKAVQDYDPGPSAYKTISKEEAQKMSQYSGAEQYETTMQMKTLQEKSGGEDKAVKE